MRNILEYPVTLDEIINCLKQLRDREAAKPLIGDMTPLLLDMAICAVRYRELKLWERGDAEGMRKALSRREK
jgi:hypothetical protein